MKSAMDREEFKRVLDGIVIPEGDQPGDINRIMSPIRDSIQKMLPNSLFRYRPIEEDPAKEDKRIDAFEQDLIVALSADQFNDPFDTLVRYDLPVIEEYVGRVMNPDSLSALKQYLSQGNDFPEAMKQMLPDEYWSNLKEIILKVEDIGVFESRIEEVRRQFISSITDLFPVISEFSKRFSRIACFSEEISSMLMWGHYASSHKGFALEYDFRPTLMEPLGRAILMPVFYTDKRFDASAYMVWAYLVMNGLPAKSLDITSYLKVALHKSKDWEYEKEWRLIDLNPGDPIHPKPSLFQFKPKAIYYGCKMPLDKRQRLHKAASEKGIKEYTMYVDYSSPEYSMNYRPVGPEDMLGE